MRKNEKKREKRSKTKKLKNKLKKFKKDVDKTKAIYYNIRVNEKLNYGG